MTGSYRPADGLRYLYIDFNAFFAAAAQHDEPALAGRPVVITPHRSEYSSAIAVSYEARPFGIRRGTKIREARHLCPAVAVRPARHDRYIRLHKELIGAIETVLPLGKVYSIDEATFRLDRTQASPDRARIQAEAVKSVIADRIGPSFRNSIGIAQTPLLAKLAAGLQKPDGLTVLMMEDLPGRLSSLALSDLPGIGPNMAQRLERSGVTNIDALWALAPKQARAIWRSVQGERFWYAFHGYEVPEPATKKGMVGHSRVLTSGLRTAKGARPVARALLLKAAARLRAMDRLATRLTLTLKDEQGRKIAFEERFDLSTDSTTFLRALDRLWERALEQVPELRRGARLGSVSIFLHGLVGEGDAEARQGSLFDGPIEADPEEADPKRARLWAAIDRLNADEEGRLARWALPDRQPDRPGQTRPRHVMLADQRDLDLDYLGTKIAFSRVPEEREFHY
ncbi:ImpB/MucB/SamB family protein [Parvularcula bermudensis HTCC2503]|uniref:DNA-directed DNA polymerase n=1 Tax=Parvularcula bermudensis (strain ATCC BAA-594 / HTCC2503 / KCTC 12087) TaxID=314260 RepID=E0TGP3_PARBH|nr:ImpB/MucB/SamB family protein [Parvularcula bermudensis]ADM10175.1 ImpB/MucB/SamB family protein [Parvularcula bermudensis HTCC2503]